MSIEAKKIFITGSTGGIGTAICNKFLNKDCILIQNIICFLSKCFSTNYLIELKIKTYIRFSNY